MTSKSSLLRNLQRPATPSRAAILGISSLANRQRFARILIGGLGGSGKTSFLGTASHTLIGESNPNLLVLEFDPSGLDTLYSMGVTTDVVRPKSYKQIRDVLAYLTTPEATQYDTVSIDSFSFMMLNIVSEEIKQEAIKKAKADGRRVEHDPEILELQDYNRYLERGKTIANDLLALQKHVIVTCHAETKIHPLDRGDKSKKDADKRYLLALALDGKMAHFLSTWFSVYGYIQKEGQGPNTHTTLSTNLFGTETKSRLDLKAVIENPCFIDILKAITSETKAFDEIEWTREKGKNYVARRRTGLALPTIGATTDTDNHSTEEVPQMQ